MPEGWAPDEGKISVEDTWWDWEEVAAAWEEKHGTPTRFVISFRRPDITGLSAVSRHLVRDLAEHRSEWVRAVSLLAEIPGAYWFSYDALIADPQKAIAALAQWLGVEAGYVLNIRDENAKWLPSLVGD